MSIDAPIFEQGARPGQDNQFRFVLNLLLEHWLAIGAATLAGGLGMVLLSWGLREAATPRYAKPAEIRIVRSQWESEALKDVAGGALFAIAPKALAERTDIPGLARAMTTAMVQEDVAQGGALGMAATPDELQQRADGLAGRIKVEAVEGDRVKVTVSASPSVAEADRMAELAARAFIEQHRRMSLEDGKRTHDFVLGELEDLQKKLFEAETREWAYKRETGFTALGRVDEEMAAHYDELRRITATRDEVDAKLAELATALEENTGLLPNALGNVTDGVVDSLFLELDELLQRRLTMSQVYQPTFPGIVDLEEEIAEKQRTIVSAFEELDRGSSGSDLWKKRQEIYAQQMDLRLQRTELEVRAKAAGRMLEDMTPQVPELANRNLKAEQLEQETNSIREEFNALTQREWKIRNALERGAAQLVRADTVHQAAAAPLGPGGGGLPVNGLIGAVAGFVLSFSFLMMREVNDTSIRSIEDVNQYLQLEVIGTIPRMRFGRPRRFLSRRRRATYVAAVDEEQIDACIVTQHDPKSPISEAYRTLRTNFQFATMKKRVRTVMMTSAVPGEGKTTTAVNLAVTMADRGMRVLIVDTDLRRPNVHRVLRMERGPGLADVLREGLDAHSVIRPTRVDNLWIISSGRVPPNPSELIGSATMGELMRQLGEQFDLVICDAPSVLVVTDPVLLATHVDTCVMVVSTGNARRETVLRAKKLLDAAKCAVAGVVVNGLEATRRHYYYYYYYYDDSASVRRRWSHIF